MLDMQWVRDGQGWWDLYVEGEPEFVVSYTQIREDWAVLRPKKHNLKIPVTEMTWQQLRKKLELEYILFRGEK